MERVSPLATITVSPFRGYTKLGDELRATPVREARARILFGAVRLVLVVGIFVSYTSTGRLSPLDVVLAAGSYGWMPFVQSLGVLAGRRLGKSTERPETLLALYFEGHGGWFVALLAIVATLLFAPDPASAAAKVAPVVVLAALGWGIVGTYAMFARGASLPRGRAIVATSAFYLVAIGSVVAYYVAAGQLLPILPLEGGPR